MTKPPQNIPFSASSEQTGLPSWLFPLGFWVAVAGLAVTLLLHELVPSVPDLTRFAVYWMMLVPVLAAVWVAAASLTTDRRLSVAAVIAVIGLVVVYVVKGLIG